LSAGFVSLRVSEAYTSDVGRNIARIDSKVMAKLGLAAGEVVKIKGKKTSVARALAIHPDDEGRGIIRMDGLLRSDTAVGIGDFVVISKVAALQGTKIKIFPLETTPSIDERYIVSAIDGYPVTKGSTIAVPYFGGRIMFRVADFMPSAEAVVVKSQTVVEIVKEVETGRSLQVTYEDVGGLKEEIQKVREMIELPLRHPEIFEKLGVEAPKGILLYGLPGTGKTMLARAVATESNAKLFTIGGPEIMSKFYGESENRLREIFKQAKEGAPSIIFIDEIDSIAPKRDDVVGEMEKRIVSQLLSLMDGLKARGKVIIIATTNRPNAIDPALRRPGRFDREIEIKVPNSEGRYEILQIHTRHMPLTEDVDLKALAAKTHGYVGADLEYLCKEAAMKALRMVLPELDLERETLIAEELDKIKVSKANFDSAFNEIVPSAMREVYLETPEVKWSDIGGLEAVKKELQEAVEWPLKYPDLYKKIGYVMPKGILVYGPPGTGKTMLAKAVATESEANFISVRGPEFISKWVGDAEKGVREVFRRARQASPCVIFFDEIDSIAPVRGATTNEVTERVVSQLLTEMDGIQPLHNVVVIAATNRIDIIDPALLRAGRFDKVINVGLPDADTRKAILTIALRGKKVAKDVNVERLTTVTEGLSGADITNVVKEAISAIVKDFITRYPDPKIASEHADEAVVTLEGLLRAVEKIRQERSLKEKAPMAAYG
jgi:transitional endoplasmic reticulum ATPase